jgi:methylated-DNA-protein-cysteine methyltransferase-like protein
MNKQNIYSRIYEIIYLIPHGKVATYGQIARLVSLPNGARQVGYALHKLKEGTDVPWFRVINRKGQISFPPDTTAASLQRSLLESEGVIFDTNNTIDLKKYQWKRFK